MDMKVEEGAVILTKFAVLLDEFGIKNEIENDLIPKLKLYEDKQLTTLSRALYPITSITSEYVSVKVIRSESEGLYSIDPKILSDKFKKEEITNMLREIRDRVVRDVLYIIEIQEDQELERFKRLLKEHSK